MGDCGRRDLKFLLLAAFLLAVGVAFIAYGKDWKIAPSAALVAPRVQTPTLPAMSSESPRSHKE